ncbi:hypothetical protein RHO13_01680 [Orbus wheelerorum]|uniref:hypothetical protein n=1 Tax=Orbus wheelerorum TaxID=3074111 RepID=UPI00370D0BEE
MTKCLNCNEDIRLGRFRTQCPFCYYPQPTWQTKTLIICWFNYAITILFLAVFFSWLFFILFFLILYLYYSILRDRKNIRLTTKRISPDFASKTTRIYGDSNIDDYTHYDQTHFSNRNELEFNDFDNHLLAIWDKERYLIAFEYINYQGNSCKRGFSLDKVLINSSNEVYFSGYFFDSNEDRIFKAEKFIFPIEYLGQKYNINLFLTQVLGLAKDYVKVLNF